MKRITGRTTRLAAIALLLAFAALLTPAIQATSAATLPNNTCPGAMQTTCVQINAPWGLDRIDQRSPTLDKRYNYAYTGNGVHVYILDGGIDIAHPQFEGRATRDYSTVKTSGGLTTWQACPHATAVAGIVGSRDYGVAKQVRLHSVKVMDCDLHGTTDQLVNGLDWVARNAQRPAVVNLSLGEEFSDYFLSPERYEKIAVEQAVKRLLDLGIFVIAAAGNGDTDAAPGNQGIDACNITPANVPGVLTVGAMRNQGQGYPEYNYGSCIDLYAPGQDIVAPTRRADGTPDHDWFSGTSFAAPHAAGAAAIYLQRYGAMASATLHDRLITDSTKGALVFGSIEKNAGTPNRLLYILPPPVPVVAP